MLLQHGRCLPQAAARRCAAPPAGAAPLPLPLALLPRRARDARAAVATRRGGAAPRSVPEGTKDVPAAAPAAGGGNGAAQPEQPAPYIANPYTSGRVSSPSFDGGRGRALRRMPHADSPFVKDNNAGAGFVGDKDRIRLHTVEYESEDSSGASCGNGASGIDEDTCLALPEWAIRSGPRKNIYFEPSQVTAAIVTCGGLCPGLNDVVQNIVFTLTDYGVPEDQIIGIRYGLRGFYDRDAKPVTLTRRAVDGIHLKGGTVLGTSRGGANIQEIVRRIDLWGLDMVFVVGGNGGNAAANAIQEEIARQDVKCVVAGVPKSIDNDILLIDKCFGFDTAVEEAQHALLAAKVEAVSGCRGLGLVKLMGRNSGFIAMQASMASGVVDVCLIPEIKFEMGKLMDHVASVLDRKGHAVVCVAEGAGQDLFAAGGSHATDASGNAILDDIGIFLRDSFKAHFKDQADIKYIDPSYLIRSIPTTSNDRIYCKVLGQGAVHGAFAGYTGFTTGLVNTHYVYLPIETIISAPRKVNPTGRRWNRLKTAINQPELA
ncbi:MAG: phosphofructokinase family protein [Monoraphidium minutum]|nr:MAG: phosphofructokinase family protein [Monoraphidium minutum]